MKNSYVFFDFAGTLVKMRPATLLARKGLLKNLANIYRLGIITGARKNEVLNILRKTQVEQYFSMVITSDNSQYKKPDLRLFPKVKIAAYIGDTKKDEILAINAKVAFFEVNNKYNVNSIIKKLI